MEMSKEKSCMRCVHFYLTWDNNFPYGCKALGFKSKHSPISVVREASGIECLYFQPKEGEKKA
jgi:hypothetical protein